MNRKPEDSLEKIVSELLRGRRLKLRGTDAEEKAAITAAARIAGTRHGPQRMHPAFRKRLQASLEQAPRDSGITRRAALVAGLGVAAGAAGGVLLGRTTRPQLAANTGGGLIDPMDGQWVDVGLLGELPEGQGRLVAAGGVRAFIFRKGDSVSAVSSICSHLPCELWWDGDKEHLACPCHPAAFKADGRPGDGSTLAPLNPVQVRITEGGRVEVLGTA